MIKENKLKMAIHINSLFKNQPKYQDSIEAKLCNKRKIFIKKNIGIINKHMLRN